MEDACVFESRLAPAPGAAVHRDLSSFEIWEISLARSRRRRDLAERQRKAAPKTKGAAAAMSAALLASPVLPIASAGAQSDGSGPASAPPNPAPDLGGVIVKRGDVGGAVAEVQRKVGVHDDAIFGPVTERAVRDFQARIGIDRTGVVDIPTWKALFRASVSFVREDSAAAKRIVARLPERQRAPKRLGGGGEQRTRVAGPPAPADAPDAPEAPRSALPARDAPASAPTTPAPAAPAADRSPSGSGACGGHIVTPVHGTVTSGFGDGRNHAGIDLAAPVGTAVRAAACGTVSLAASQSGYGNIICIQHSSSFSTCYAHLSSMGVEQGSYVDVGQVIGRVGMTGHTTGPHLHFETRVGGRAQNPAPYLSRAKSIPGKPRAEQRAMARPEAKTTTSRAAALRSADSRHDRGTAVAPQTRMATAAAVGSPPSTGAASAPAPAPAPGARTAAPVAPPDATATTMAVPASAVAAPSAPAEPAPQPSAPAPQAPSPTAQPAASAPQPATPALQPAASAQPPTPAAQPAASAQPPTPAAQPAVSAAQPEADVPAAPAQATDPAPADAATPPAQQAAPVADAATP